jgi:phosphopantothenoylcysteine decarboxylase/phosphopantothenate--cysteine ligase
VTLIAAHTTTSAPFGVERVPVSTAKEMAAEVARRHRAHDLLVMAAAVADYRPSRVQSAKIESGKPDWSLALTRTVDVLASIRGQRKGAVTVGFALEIGGTEAARRRAAREKLARKGLDLIVLNDPSRAGSEFGSAENEVALIEESGEVRLPRMEKEEVAARILDRAEELLRERRSHAVEELPREHRSRASAAWAEQQSPRASKSAARGGGSRPSEQPARERRSRSNKERPAARQGGDKKVRRAGR